VRIFSIAWPHQKNYAPPRVRSYCFGSQAKGIKIPRGSGAFDRD
jgi:hypothetical protein